MGIGNVNAFKYLTLRGQRSQQPKAVDSPQRDLILAKIRRYPGGVFVWENTDEMNGRRNARTSSRHSICEQIRCSALDVELGLVNAHGSWADRARG